MAIHLITFGGLRAFGDAGELDGLLSQHSRAALLVYLAVERRVSRESLATVFWPESDAENARHALRQSLYQLRKAVGGAEWVESRAHELVVTGDVRTDVHDFTGALERGDVSAAVDFYRGPFLDGVHLVDLSPWETWVDGRRAQYARAFRKACRELIDARRAAGDHAGVIEAAERWTASDPADGEAQHRLIEALAGAGERAEAIRQYEAHARSLEADGLRPLDETRALLERLRAESGSLPALRPLAASVSEVERPLVRATPPAVSTHEDVAGARLETDRVRSETDRLTPAIRRPRRLLLLSAVAVGVVLSGMWVLRRRQPPAATATTATSTAIAVLPFSVRGGDAVTYLGEGMVTLLGAALDGAGQVRPVDTRATFAAVAGANDSLPIVPRGDGVARRLGASMFVLGDVVEAGGQLHIEAAIYHIGGGCGPPGSRINAVAECAAPEPAAKAVVSGSADSAFALVDRLAARLLGGLGDPAADRLVRTASLTTTSLPAFKSYLEGEASMRSGEFERAADSYLAALARDSTFAVAYYRLALAREWAPLPGEDAAASAAARHATRLSARDRDLLEAFRQWRAGDAAAAERAYRSILGRYPDDVDAQFQLGEILFHHGPLFGRAIDESEDAWRVVLAHEPRNVFAITHVARIAALRGRVAAVDSLLAPFTADELRTDRRLAEIVLLRSVAQGDTAAARSLARDVRRWDPFAVWRVAVFLTAFAPAPAIMRQVVADLTEDFPSPAQRADLLWFASMLDLAGGRADAAGKALAQAIGAERTVPADRRRSGFGDVTAWFAATLPLPYADSTLARVRRQVASRPPSAERRPAFQTEMGIGAPVQLEPVRLYTLGTLSLRLRDTASASAAAASLERLVAAGGATALTRDLDRGLRARIAFQARRPQDALRLLETLESRDSQGDVNTIPFVSRANERFLRGEVLLSLGRDSEALRWFGSLGDGSVTEIPFRAPSHLRQAEIHGRLGNGEQAARHYARFLELWRACDPAFQPMVDDAHRRRASLTRTK